MSMTNEERMMFVREALEGLRLKADKGLLLFDEESVTDVTQRIVDRWETDIDDHTFEAREALRQELRRL